MNAPRRPVLRWHGGKFRMANWIIGFFPPHHAYCEPYAGAASVLMRKRRSAAECLNDLDRAVVNVFRVLRAPDSAGRLKELVELTPFARDELRAAYEPTDDPIEAARRTITLAFLGYGSDSVTRGYTTGFRGTRLNDRALPSLDWMRWPEAIPAFTERLRGVSIENGDALKVMAQMDRPSTLFYVDPPYLPETRSSKYVSRNKNGYRHELTRQDHVALLKVLRSLKGMIVLSGYPSALYDKTLKGWRRHEIESLADGARPRTEVGVAQPGLRRGARSPQSGGHGMPLFSRRSPLDRLAVEAAE